jgi:hypothetical protein
VALPEEPVELDHVTDVTLAVAVPLNAMVAADVETMVIAGEAMVSDGGPEGDVVTGGVVTGGVVTGGVVTGGVVTGGVVAACWVTVIDAEAEFPAPSVARTIIVFAPMASGTDATDQFADPAAGPDPPWLLLQTT